jgi:hypothetical protein
MSDNVSDNWEGYVVETAANASKRYKTYSITRNSTHDADAMLEDLKKVGEIRRVVIGREKGSGTGRKHLQCAVTFRTATTEQNVRRKVPGHVEPARYVEKLFNYCKKEGDFLEEGQPSQQGKRTDLGNAVDLLKEGGLKAVALEHPETFVKFSRGFQALENQLTSFRSVDEPPKVFWITGETGCGKTRQVVRLEGSDPDSVWFSNDELKWFDGYRGQRVVCLDDFRGNQCKFAFLLRLLDRYPLRVPIKGDFVPWKPEKVYITSTLAPHECYPNLKGRDGIKQLLRRITYVCDDQSALEGRESWKQFLESYEEGAHIKAGVTAWREAREALEIATPAQANHFVF